MQKQFLFGCALMSSLALFAGSHWNGGRNVPVHKLAPLDAEGEKVGPRDAGARAISTVQTCSQCHELKKMKGGSHFRTGLDADEAKPSVTVEPWFLIDSATGSQIPLSLHGQGGAYAPGQLGLTSWEWTKTFARHFPGGGIGSDERALAEPASPTKSNNRWFVTGALEPNCFACHADTAEYDHSEWVRQIYRENFSGAMTAALGLADVEGMNCRLPDHWSPSVGPNPDDHVFEVPQEVHYDLGKFDDKDRVTFPVGRPKSANCLACHSATEKGMEAHDLERNVHLRAGLSCTDCHTCGMDHRIATTSCAECHTKGDSRGKLRGPRPKHTGFPPVHFEKLACTVCHSGVTKEGRLAEVRTSRANRIGVYGRAQWATDAPYVLEPVFSRDADGKIRPNRVMWPAFFAKVGDKGVLEPLAPADAAALAGDALTPVARVEKALAALNSNPNRPGDAVLTEKGVFFRVGDKDEPLWLEPLPKDLGGTELENVNKQLSNVLQSLATMLPESCKDIPVAFRDGKAIGYFFKYIEGHKEGGDIDMYEMSDFKSAPKDGELRIGFFKDGKDEYVPLFDLYTRAEYLKHLAAPDCPLSMEMVAAALEKMGPDYRYIAQGCIFGVKDGKLYHSTGDIASPVAWPVSHDVRPAGQALGSAPQKCAECHTADSSFFFGKILPTGPIADFDASDAAIDRAEALGVNGLYHRAFGFTFLMRPLFKTFLWIVFALSCLFAIAAAAAAIPQGLKGLRGKAAEWKLVRALLVLMLAASAAYLAISGAIGWLCGGMTGWLLMLHMVAGGAFACAVFGLAALRGDVQARRAPLVYAAAAVLAAGTLVTAVMPMMTVFGDQGQHFLLAAHRCCAFTCAALCAVLCVAARKK